jgi:hypothetical protein
LASVEVMFGNRLVDTYEEERAMVSSFVIRASVLLACVSFCWPVGAHSSGIENSKSNLHESTANKQGDIVDICSMEFHRIRRLGSGYYAHADLVRYKGQLAVLKTPQNHASTCVESCISKSYLCTSASFYCVEFRSLVDQNDLRNLRTRILPYQTFFLFLSSFRNPIFEEEINALKKVAGHPLILRILGMLQILYFLRVFFNLADDYG